jgi:hypothetical protein
MEINQFVYAYFPSTRQCNADQCFSYCSSLRIINCTTFPHSISGRNNIQSVSNRGKRFFMIQATYTEILFFKRLLLYWMNRTRRGAPFPVNPEKRRVRTLILVNAENAIPLPPLKFRWTGQSLWPES